MWKETFYALADAIKQKYLFRDESNVLEMLRLSAEEANKELSGLKHYDIMLKIMQDCKALLDPNDRNELELIKQIEGQIETIV